MVMTFSSAESENVDEEGSSVAPIWEDCGRMFDVARIVGECLGLRENVRCCEECGRMFDVAGIAGECSMPAMKLTACLAQVMAACAPAVTATQGLSDLLLRATSARNFPA